LKKAGKFKKNLRETAFPSTQHKAVVTEEKNNKISFFPCSLYKCKAILTLLKM
jgi:hypothetical protein